MKALSSFDVDLKTFDELYLKYHKAVFRNIKKLIHDDETALDILQEVFMTFWEKKDNFKDRNSIGGWLFVVSYNKSISYLRLKVRESIHSSEEFFIKIPDEQKELKDQEENDYLLKMKVLKEAVDFLPERKKEVFQLYRFEGLSKEEVANQLELSKDTVKEYLKQSNQMIKRYVAKKYPSMLSLTITISFMDYFS